LVRLPFLLLLGFGALIAGLCGGRSIDVAIDVGPLVDVHVSIDVHIHVAVVTAAPNPNTARTDPNAATMPVAVVGNNSAHGHADAEGYERRVWIVHVRRGRIVHGGRVCRHINHLGIGRLNLNHLICDHQHLGLLDDFVRNSHDLLWGGLKRAGLRGFGAK
jgi:hypothetical protein